VHYLHESEQEAACDVAGRLLGIVEEVDDGRERGIEVELEVSTDEEDYGGNNLDRPRRHEGFFP